MDDLDFSEEEILEQLAILGYKNVPKHKLREFKQDLDELIQHGEWKTLASYSTTSPAATYQHSPPAYTKEKVSQSYNNVSGEGFFLHAAKANYDRQAPAACQNKDYGSQQRKCDSYAQHSVALKVQLPPGAPSRLQAEPDLENSLQSALTGSYTSSPEAQERCCIRRKVLRKHKGQSLVCDESVYSDDSALCLHRSHTSAGAQVHTMYKMYDTQWDGESDDENSLNSSFWSDGETQERDEVVERVTDEEDSSHVAEAEDGLQKGSEEEEPERNDHSNVTGESAEEEDESCSSRSDSPAQSLMTSGYGTYRPEEQEGGDYRDQDSRADLSEVRDDDKDDRSLCSFGPFDPEPDCHQTCPGSDSADGEPEAEVDQRGDGAPHVELDYEYVKPGEGNGQAGEQGVENELHRESEENQAGPVAGDKFLLDENHEDHEEEQQYGELENEQESNMKEEAEDKMESDESSSNKDIKFIDSTVDSSWMMYDEMCGNLRQEKDAASCLDERLADLHLSTAAQRETPGTESEDASSQSQSDGISLSAFESYICGLAQGDGDFRPKPKSFIRPAVSQPALKKTDPVAKYFQYKQLWEMFKLPGEKDRRALRWEIREQLAYQPPPPKPRRVYVPNTYVVPTEKKRSALRWEIRNDLANGLIPYKCNY